MHAKRMAARAEAQARAEAPAASDAYHGAAPSPRSRLDTFREQQARGGGAMASPRRLDSFRQQQAAASSSGGAAAASPAIPALGLGSVGSAASLAGGAGLGTDRPLSTRRLKKEVLRADTQDEATANAAGTITLTDSLGTPRSVRVVQQQAREDFNMVSVKWVYTLDGATYQIELRHGRKSGIRKIYLNKELLERSKNLSDRFIDRGSKHQFRVGTKVTRRHCLLLHHRHRHHRHTSTVTTSSTTTSQTAEILIIPGRSAGFKYELRIDDEPIERDLGITAAGLSAELGTHFVRPAAPLHGAGFGMTLANCGNRSDGVVVIELEPGLPSHQAGLLVGDVVLSVNETMCVDTTVILDRLGACRESITLEVAGSSPSRLVVVPNPFHGGGGANGSLALADTSCGVGVYVKAVTPAPSAPRGAARLELGDVILSVDGAVTESARETTKYLQRGPPQLTFVIAGRTMTGVGVGAYGQGGMGA